MHFSKVRFFVLFIFSGRITLNIGRVQDHVPSTGVGYRLGSENVKKVI